MDRICYLPDSIVDKILCSLPIFDAVKTSVLARGWRYKWLTLSKLIFNETFWHASLKHDEIELHKFVSLVTTMLLQHVCSLDELHIWIPEYLYAKSQILSPPVQFALKKGVKKLSLSYCPVDLPACIYSSAQLTHLKLERDPCTFHPPAVFDGLRNLVSFELRSVYECSGYEDSGKIMNFISNCPKIKRISLYTTTDRDIEIHAPTLEYLAVGGVFPGICFQEPGNVKELHVEFADCDNFCPEKCGIMNFFSCLVKLETFKFYCHTLEPLLSSAVHGKPLRGTLEQLKTLELYNVYSSSQKELHGLLCLLSSSPNLCKLVVHFYPEYEDENVDAMGIESSLDTCKEDKFESLKIVQLRIEGRMIDIKIIAFLLGSCPTLETMIIRYSSFVTLNIMEVMKLPRASPKARLEIRQFEDPASFIPRSLARGKSQVFP